jgi:hypothetical protein
MQPIRLFPLLLACVGSLMLVACEADPPLTPYDAATTPDDTSTPLDVPDVLLQPDADGPDAPTPDAPLPDDVPRDSLPLDAPRDTPPLDAPRDATTPDVVLQDTALDVSRDAAVVVDARMDVASDLGPVITCSVCRSTRCMSTNDACQRSVFCVERFTCLDRCPRSPSPADCRSGCVRAWPATTQSSAFIACLRAECPSSCPDYL